MRLGFRLPAPQAKPCTAHHMQASRLASEIPAPLTQHASQADGQPQRAKRLRHSKQIGHCISFQGGFRPYMRLGRAFSERPTKLPTPLPPARTLPRSLLG